MIRNKPDSLSKLISEADDAFSLFIRARDAGPDGYLNCFTCGKRIHWKREADAAHFNDIDQMATRYDEVNVNACCQDCNRFDPTHRMRYTLAMICKHGFEFVDELMHKKHSLMKFMRFEVEEIRDSYKLKFNELKKEKGL